MNRSRWSLVVTLLLVLSALLAACQPAATPAAPTGAPQPTAAPAQPTAAPAQPTTAPTAAPQPTAAPAVEPTKAAAEPTAAAAAAPTAAAAEPTAAAAAGTGKALKIAFVFPGLINEGGFNQLGYAALEQAKKDLGADTTYVESITDTDAPKILRDYASKGYDVIVAWSGSFPTAVAQVAGDFPKTSFVTLSDPGNYPKNVWLVGTDFEDAYYLAGALAGLTTKTNKIGHVLAIPIPIYSAGAKSFTLGAKAVNPKAEVYETFIGDFNDAVKAKQTTTAQIEQGADIIQSSLDMGVLGVIEAAKAAKGTQVMGIMVDQHDSAPDTFLTSVMQDYPTALNGIFKQIAGGTLGGFQTMNLKSGMASLANLDGRVPADTLAKLADIQKKLEAGEIKIVTPADLPKQ